MKKITLSALLFLVAASAPAQLAAPPKMLLASKKLGALIVEDGKVLKRFPARGICQDAWLLEDGSVLLSEKVGVTRFDQDGKVLLRYTVANRKSEIHACQPLPGGGILVSESAPPRLLELNADGKVVRTVAVKDIKYGNAHLQMRAARKNKQGEYGIVSSGEMRVVLLNPDGTSKKIIDLRKLPGFIKHKYSHGFAFLDNGNILASTSYGGCFVELDLNGKMVWSLTPQDLPELELKYASGMQRLANGNTVCTAFNSKYPVFEVTPEKKIVWKMPASGEIGDILHVQIVNEPGRPSNFGLQK
jgi:outer membrane protein assembly factor BamB